MLFANAENRLKGAKELPAANLGARNTQLLIDNCTAEYEQIRGLLSRAGMDLAADRAGKKIARVELRDPEIRVPVRLNIGPLMATLLPESPGWYLLSSGTTHRVCA